MTEEERWFCVAWSQSERKAVPVTKEEIPSYLERGTPIWLDILTPTEEETEWLGEVFDFHELALTDLLNNEVRPKQESYSDILFTVFGAINLNPGEDALDTINLNLFLTPVFLVTTHLKPLKTIRNARKRVLRAHGPLEQGTDHLYYTLLDGVVDRYLDILDEVEEEIETIEREVFGAANSDVQRMIFTCKRRIAFMRRSIGPKRDALRDLVYQSVPQIKDETRTHLRDVLDHTMRILDRLESYRELLNGLMDSYMGQISNRMNEVMKLLSIIATLMLPLSFLTGIFGMNFDVLPGIHWEKGFWALVAFMAALAALMLWLFKRQKLL